MATGRRRVGRGQVSLPLTPAAKAARSRERPSDVLYYSMLAVIVLALLGAARAGWGFVAVLSSSMEPELPAGSLAVRRPLDPGKIRAGDVITFRNASGNLLTTHRVVAVQGGSSLRFITQGDANAAADPDPVAAEQLVGKIIFQLPHLGRILLFIRSRQGFFVLIFLPGLLLMGLEMRTIWHLLHYRPARLPRCRIPQHPLQTIWAPPAKRARWLKEQQEKWSNVARQPGNTHPASNGSPRPAPANAERPPALRTKPRRNLLKILSSRQINLCETDFNREDLLLSLTRQ